MNQGYRPVARTGRSRHGAFWILFVLSLVLHCLPALIRRIPLAGSEELIATEMAKSIHSGNGFSVYGVLLSSGGVLYPLLLSPFYALKDSGLRMVLLSLLNGALLCSALIPAWLLTQRLVKNRTWQFAALLIFALSPAMMLSVTFLPDNLYLPLFLWTLYFAFRFWEWEGKEGGLLFALLAGGFAALLCLTKMEGEAFAAVLAVVFPTAAGRRKEWKNIGAFLLALVVPLFGIRMICFGFGGLFPMITAAAARFMTPMDTMYWLLEAVFLLVFLVWGRFLLPVCLPCVGFRTESTAKKNTLILLSCTGVLTAFFAAWPLATEKNILSMKPVLSLRNFLPLLLPFLLLALSAAEKEETGDSRLSGREKLFRSFGALLFLFAVFLFVQRVGTGAPYDAPVLHWVNSVLTGSPNIGIWLLAGSALLLAGLLILRWQGKGKTFGTVLCVLLLATGTVDSVTFLTDVFPMLTAPAEQAGMEEAENLSKVLENLQGRVLIVTDRYDSDMLRQLSLYTNKSCTVTTWEDMTAAASTGGEVMTLTPGEEFLPVPETLRQYTSSETHDFTCPDWVVSLRPNLRPLGQFEEQDIFAPAGQKQVRVFRNLHPEYSFAFYGAPNYTPGTVLGFSADNSTFLAYPHYGFSGQEIGFTWTCETVAGLTLKPDRAPEEAMTATISYLHVLGKQHLIVFGNGIPLYEGDVEAFGEDLVFPVPAAVFSPSGEIAFRFEIPQAAPPGTGDPRTLGIAFSTFTLTLP